MNKRLVIKLDDKRYMKTSNDFVEPDHLGLAFSECNNIISKIEKYFDGSLGNISDKDFSDALDLIISYMYINKHSIYIIDIDERNKVNTQAKEMTLEEIERRLGHKVKIVSDKENKNGCY